MISVVQIPVHNPLLYTLIRKELIKNYPTSTIGDVLFGIENPFVPPSPPLSTPVISPAHTPGMPLISMLQRLSKSTSQTVNKSQESVQPAQNAHLTGQVEIDGEWKQFIVEWTDNRNVTNCN